VKNIEKLTLHRGSDYPEYLFTNRPTALYDWQAKRLASALGPIVPPFAAIIDVTSWCNSRCTYCKCWLEEPGEEMTDDEIERVLQELAQLGVPRVCFSGGEPLLRDTLPKLVKHASQLGIAPWVNTNGILLTPQMAKDLVSAGLKYFLLSVDALDPAIYKAHRGVNFTVVPWATRAIAAAIKDHSDTRAALVCVLSRLNLDGIEPLANFCIEQGFRLIIEPYNPRAANRGGDDDALLIREGDRAYLQGVIETLLHLRAQHPKIIVNSKEYLRAIPAFVLDGDMPPDFQCLVGWTTINVHSQGEVKPCQHFCTIGNIRQQNLLDIWHSDIYRQARIAARDLQCIRCWTCGHVDMLVAAPVLEG